jgi:hypothetical protein
MIQIKISVYSKKLNFRDCCNPKLSVIPAKAGISNSLKTLDPSLRGGDKKGLKFQIATVPFKINLLNQFMGD